MPATDPLSSSGLSHNDCFRRLDRSAKREAERPSLDNKRLIVERRSLRSGLRPSVETTEIATCGSPAVILSVARGLYWASKAPRYARGDSHDSLLAMVGTRL